MTFIRIKFEIVTFEPSDEDVRVNFYRASSCIKLSKFELIEYGVVSSA